MSELAPGLRIIVRDEEWMINKIENNSFGNKAVYCTGISPLVKDKESVFLEDLEEVSIVDPAQTKLVADTSPLFKKSKLYIESNLRQKIPSSNGFNGLSISSYNHEFINAKTKNSYC